MSIESLADALLASDDVAAVPLAREIVPVLCSRTGLSSAGFPFLGADAHAHFRDRVPHVLAMGPVALRALEHVAPLAAAAATDAEDREHLERAERVIRTMLNTATITAPPDLWLLRHVLGTTKSLGLLDRLLAGETLDPDACSVHLGADSDEVSLSDQELEAALRFLSTRRYLVQSEAGYTISASPRVRDVFARVTPTPEFVPAGVARIWKRLFGGIALDPHEIAILARLGTPPLARSGVAQAEWTATLEEIELGYRVVPIVLGLRHAERTAQLAKGELARPSDLSPAHPELVAGAFDLLAVAGAVAPQGDAGDAAMRAIARTRRLPSDDVSSVAGPGPSGSSRPIIRT